MDVSRNEFDLLTPRQKAEKLDEQAMENCRLRAVLARHLSFRTKAIALLSAAEREFDKIAVENGGEPQFLIHCQIRDWLNEVTATLSSQSSGDCDAREK